MYGIPIEKALHTKRSFDFMIYQSVANRVAQLQRERDRNMAAEIANAVGKMLGGS